jgi:hypothetical protein
MTDRKAVVNGFLYEEKKDILEVHPCQSWGSEDGMIRSSILFSSEDGISNCRCNVVRLTPENFRYSSLRKILIPSSVEFIGAGCFFECKCLCEIVFEFGSKLQCIEHDAFYGNAIKTIRIPSSVEFIGECCFSGCKSSLCEVTFETGSKLRRIEENAFDYTALKTIRIPSNVEYIGRSCFYGCTSLCEVTFESESSLKTIGDYAFETTNLKRFEIPNQCEITSFSVIGVKEVVCRKENSMFVQEGLFIKSFDKKILIRYIEKRDYERIVVGAEVEIISRGCFMKCIFKSLREFTFEFGSKLRCIEDHAFRWSGIKRIEIPSNVEFLGSNCFSGCKSL